MIRPTALGSLVVAVYAVAVAVPAAAQFTTVPASLAQIAAPPQADLRGIVLDERGEPLPGVVVSAIGSITVFTLSDPDGRFAFRDLSYGPYLVRAHLQGYLPARARLVQVNHATTPLPAIALMRRADPEQPPPVLAAGIGPAAGEGVDVEGQTHDHGEVAWRLRHLKRSVLKDSATAAVVVVDDEDSFLEDSIASLGRAMGSSARLASALFSDLPLTGQIDLLTSTSFDRPQDLFLGDAWLPRGVAFVSLQAPTAAGEWRMRGAVTQGDLASWILAGSYVRSAPANHRYEAGLSYAMQRYRGGNADALASVSDGSRNVGTVYGYDDWAVTSRLSVGYGAKYARYDYLDQEGLLSPRASVTVAPTPDRKLRIRAAASRRVIAPGAGEFIPPASGLWLPPERTFSPLSSRGAFTSERIDHLELAAERDWSGGVVVGVRAFRQTVDDQLVTLFGVTLPGTAPTNVGHYYVTSGGDLEARGWGISVSRVVPDGLSASVDYTLVDSVWTRHSPHAATLSLVADSLFRGDDERIHDLTTSIESVIPVTDTRLCIIYKINSGFSDAGVGAPSLASRFDVQLNQALPFLNFAKGDWEMLVAIRNLFRDELLDASVYDELLVVRPPKRVVGGVTVRF